MHIVDISDPLNPTFAGCATVDYRFPGSGNVVLSLAEEQTNGLMVLRPTLGGSAAARTGASPRGVY